MEKRGMVNVLNILNTLINTVLAWVLISKLLFHRLLGRMANGVDLDQTTPSRAV